MVLHPWHVDLCRSVLFYIVFKRWGPINWVGPVRRRSAVRRVLRARCHHCLDDASSLLFDHSYCRSTQVDSRVYRLTALQPLMEILIIEKVLKSFA
jgi:hypothetical protein